jgi:hypothetical protein
MCSIDLVESPEQVLGSAVDIVAARVVGEVVAQWGSRKLRFKEIDLVEEQDDAGSHEPSTVDDRVEEYQTLHHAILEARVSRGTAESFCRLTCELSSNSTWSYSLNATQKMMDVTFSKQCIHFLRSLRWPPTSNMLFAVSPRAQRPV